MCALACVRLNVGSGEREPADADEADDAGRDEVFAPREREDEEGAESEDEDENEPIESTDISDTCDCCDGCDCEDEKPDEARSGERALEPGDCDSDCECDCDCDCD